MLLVRVIAATLCVTLAASLAARQGSTTMAAFQVCLQIWLATSLLADGLAVAGQVSHVFLRNKRQLRVTLMLSSTEHDSDFRYLILGNSCERLCNKRLQQSHCHRLSRIAGS